MGKSGEEVGDPFFMEGGHEGFACSPLVLFHSVASFLLWTICTHTKGHYVPLKLVRYPQRGFYLSISSLVSTFSPISPDSFNVFSPFPPFLPIFTHFSPFYLFLPIFYIFLFFLGNVVGNLIAGCVGKFWALRVSQRTHHGKNRKSKNSDLCLSFFLPYKKFFVLLAI